MELNQLRYFLEVYKIKNFSKAAENLYISQSALSQQIKKLEDELSLKLFNRDSHNLSITSDGEYLYSYVKDVISSFNCLSHAIEERQKDSVNKLRVLTTTRYIYPDIDSVICQFYSDNNDVTIELEHCLDSALPPLKQLNSYDVLILRKAFALPFISSKEYEVKIISHEPVCLLASKEHPLANFDSVNLKDIEGKYKIIGPRNMPDDIKNITQIDNIPFMAELVKKMNYLSIGLPSTARYFDLKAVTFLPLTYADTFFIYPKKSVNVPALKDFYTFLKEYYTTKASKEKMEKL